MYELPFFRRPERTSPGKVGWAAGRSAASSRSRPAHRCSVAAGNDYAGVGQDGSMSNGGQFWVMNGTPSVVHQIAANGAGGSQYWFTTTDSSGKLLWSQPAAGYVQFAACRLPQRDPQPRLLQHAIRALQEVRHHGAHRIAVPRRGVRPINHPNWGGASFNPTNLSTFGKITSKTGDVRNLQLSLRLYF